MEHFTVRVRGATRRLFGTESINHRKVYERFQNEGVSLYKSLAKTKGDNGQTIGTESRPFRKYMNVLRTKEFLCQSHR